MPYVIAVLLVTLWIAVMVCAVVVVTEAFTFWGGFDSVQSGSVDFFTRLLEKNHAWGR